MKTTSGHTSSDTRAAAIRDRPHPLRAKFAKGGFDDLPVAVLCFDRGGLIDVNAEWVAATGYNVFASAGDSWLTAIHPDDRDDASSCVRTAESAADTEINLRLLGTGGSAHWFRGHVRFVGEDDESLRLLTLTAVGAHRSNEARLLHMSTHDGLTGLANRSKFVGRIKREMAASTGLAGMLFIDLDHFKNVNDHLGHRYGDAVLQAACKRVEKTIRETELAGRLGGDEIGVFCPQIETRSDVFALAERIGESLATPFQIGTEIVIIDASVGIAFTDDDNVTTVESLVEAADRAMYVAKTAGGGRWATLDEQRPAPTQIDVDGDLFLARIRAGVDRAEEHTMLAWQRSTVSHDFERSARLAAIREALRCASLLLRTPTDVTSASDTIVDHRPARLHADLEAGIAIAQATGMIAQRTGCETSQAALLLRAFATTRDVAVANAARMVVNRETEIDSVATTRWPPRLEHPSTVPAQIESRHPESPERLGHLHKIYGEHSAAVYGCAAFICGAHATMVTVEAFVTFWHQPDSARINPTNVRIRLVAIAHRLAMRAAMSMVRTEDNSAMPSADADAVLSRGQAVERMLACANLTATERSVAALVIYGRCASNEVARILGQEEPHVYQQLTSGLRHLRTALAAVE